MDIEDALYAYLSGHIGTATISDGGTGYQVNDVLTVVQTGASGGTLTVNTVDGTGTILTTTLTTGGSGYSSATGLATTVAPAGGTGAKVTIATVVALAGNRIYPDDLPLHPVYPAVVFERTSGDRYKAMGKRPGIAYPIYKFTAWAEKKSVAVSVADQLRAALDYHMAGTMGGAGGVEIEFIILEDEYDEETDRLMIGKAATKQYGRCLEFTINYRE